MKYYILIFSLLTFVGINCCNPCNTTCGYSSNAVINYPLKSNSCSLVPHASIISWMPGSYGSYPGIGRGRPPLPIWVRINFDKSVAEDFANKFFQFLIQSIDSLTKVKNYKVSKHKLGGFVITVLPSVKQEQLQDLVDRANSHFDPEYKSVKELAEIKAKEIIQQEVMEKLLSEETLKKQFEIECLKKEAEKRVKDERSKRLVKLQEEQKRKNEENLLRREKENKIKLEETKKFKDTMSNSKQVFSMVEQAEYQRIMWQIAVIKEQYPALSSARGLVIKQLLEDVGTTVSYKIYQEMVVSGELK